MTPLTSVLTWRLQRLRSQFWDCCAGGSLMSRACGTHNWRYCEWYLRRRSTMQPSGVEPGLYST